jgi:hypothetical protein
LDAKLGAEAPAASAETLKQLARQSAPKTGRPVTFPASPNIASSYRHQSQYRKTIIPPIDTRLAGGGKDAIFRHSAASSKL